MAEATDDVRCEWGYKELDRPRMKGERVRTLMMAIRREFHMALVRTGGNVERARKQVRESSKEISLFARDNDHPKMFEMAVAYPPMPLDEWETVMAFIRVQEAIDEGAISEEDGNGLRTMHILTRRNAPDERVDLRTMSIADALAKVRLLSMRAASASASSGGGAAVAASSAVTRTKRTLL